MKFFFSSLFVLFFSFLIWFSFTKIWWWKMVESSSNDYWTAANALHRTHQPSFSTTHIEITLIFFKRKFYSLFPLLGFVILGHAKPWCSDHLTSVSRNQPNWLWGNKKSCFLNDISLLINLINGKVKQLASMLYVNFSSTYTPITNVTSMTFQARAW